MTASTASSWVDDVREAKAAIDARRLAKRGRTLGAALDAPPAVLRIRYCYDRALRPYHDLTAYTDTFHRIWFDEDVFVDRVVRADLIAWAFEQFPDVDWRLGWDIHLACGHITAAPPLHLPIPTTTGSRS